MLKPIKNMVILARKHMKILSIFGTRPEAVKMVPVIRALAQHSHQVESRVCVTGQHREMLDQMLKFFKISSDYDLNLMQKQQDLASLTSLTLTSLQPVLEDFQPDWILVQGDTTTALTATLAAFYRKIKIGHIEAGLRTYNLNSPWPEEANRRLISVMANVSYAPTALSAKRLQAEGMMESTIQVTGNTVIDTLCWVIEQISTNIELKHELQQQFAWLNPHKRLILVTGHRRENWESGLSRTFQALKKIAQRDDVEIIYPVHLNPQVFNQAQNILKDQPNIFLIEPAGYLPFIYLMQRCYLIVTDSGGVQEEAPTLKKPVLITRDTTERPEALEAGTARLVGTDADTIESNLHQLLDQPDIYNAMISTNNPFGDGQAAQRIVADLLKRFNLPHSSH